MNFEKKSPLTFRAILTGIIGLAIITSSSMYVSLRMGALPWPTVFVTVLSMAILGKAKGSTLAEINCTHTLMSAGAMVAGGLAFTLPGLWIRDPNAEFSYLSIVIISVTGAVLGILFTSIFRETFIDKEKLPYPMGIAAYKTLIAGKEGKGAPVLFSSMGFSAIFTFLRDKLLVIPSTLTLFGGSAIIPPLYLWVSPMALGIGAIIGPALAIMWFLGSVLGYYVITPIGLSAGFFESMVEADLFRSNLGLGLMIGTGAGVAIVSIIKLFKNNSGKKIDIKQKKDKLLTGVIVAFFAIILLTVFTEIKLAEAILLIIGAYLAAYLSGMLTGQTGINPMEVFAILVLLFISTLFSPTIKAGFSIAAVVAVAAGLTGDVMNDLKSGSLVGTNPRHQMIAETIGGVIGAIIASLALIVLKNSFGGFGTAELPSPQAASVAAMMGGIGNKTAFFLGVIIGIILYIAKVPAATLGLGFYLSTSISSIMALGVIISSMAKKLAKNSQKADENASFVSAGLLGGEGITGVIIAIASMF